VAKKVQIHIFGSVAEGSTYKTQLLVKKTFFDLCNEFENLSYFGGYDNEAIEGVLDKYQIMLAPYKSDHYSTRYIEPLRYYHALNRGLEVISTPIPALKNVSEFVHVIRSSDDFWTVLRGLSNEPEGEKNHVNQFKAVTWNTRARSLVELVQHYNGTKKVR
jgi:hypothetical protein